MQHVVAFLRVPDALVETAKTAMQMIRAVVFRKLILNSVQSESTAGDPVRMTPNQSSEVTWITDVFIKRLKTQYDVAENTVTVGRSE